MFVGLLASSDNGERGASGHEACNDADELLCARSHRRPRAACVLIPHVCLSTHLLSPSHLCCDRNPPPSLCFCCFLSDTPPLSLSLASDSIPIPAFTLANLACWLCMAAGVCHFFVGCCCMKTVEQALKAGRKGYLLNNGKWRGNRRSRGDKSPLNASEHGTVDDPLEAGISLNDISTELSDDGSTGSIPLTEGNLTTHDR